MLDVPLVLWRVCCFPLYLLSLFQAIFAWILKEDFSWKERDKFIINGEFLEK